MLVVLCTMLLALLGVNSGAPTTLQMGSWSKKTQIVHAAHPAADAPLFDSLFWDEGIDTNRFHDCLKAGLARVMLDIAEEEDTTGNTKRGSSKLHRQPTALVVGVEYGTEVIKLADAGYEVIGIEPFPEYVAHVVTEAAKANVLDKVNLYSAGAGAERGTMNITYYRGTVTTPIVRLDDIVKERPIDILSVDVHGGATNYDVLMGGKEALNRGLFKSIWCEVFPDARRDGLGDWGVKLLDMLRAHDYVMYDVQWSGGAKSCELNGIPSNKCREHKTYSGARPLESAQAYLDAMHSVLKTDFQYLQMDFVAVPRALTGRVESAFRRVSAACKQS